MPKKGPGFLARALLKLDRLFARSVHRRNDEFRAILDASRAPAAEGEHAQTGNRPVSSSSE